MRKIFRFLHSLFCWAAIFIIILILGFSIIGNLAYFVRDRKKIFHWGSQVWAKAVLWLMKIKVTTAGLEIPQEGNYIFAPNHTSSLDIFILIASIPRRFLFVMNGELFKVPFGGKYCKMAGYLPISRKHPQENYRDLQRIITNLKQGESIVFFPGGGRSRSGGLEEFKAGIGQIAAASGIPVIPVAISGSAQLLPRGSFIIYPGRARVQFGKPLHFQSSDSCQEIAQKIRSEIQQMLEA